MDVNDEVFKEVQASMNLIGSSSIPHNSEEELEHSISLCKDNLLEEDENIKVMASYLLMDLRFQNFHDGLIDIILSNDCLQQDSWISKMTSSFWGQKEVELQGSINYQGFHILLKTYLQPKC